MSLIAAEIDAFIELATPELERQLDEAIAELPPDFRAAATRCRRRLLRQFVEHCRAVNLRRRLDELEAGLRPTDAQVH